MVAVITPSNINGLPTSYAIRYRITHQKDIGSRTKVYGRNYAYNYVYQIFRKREPIKCRLIDNDR